MSSRLWPGEAVETEGDLSICIKLLSNSISRICYTGGPDTTTFSTRRASDGRQLPIFVWTLEHPRGGRPVRPDGSPVGGVRAEAEDVQATRLRRRAVPRRRRRARPGGPVGGRSGEEGGGRQEDVGRRGPGGRVRRPPALGAPQRHRRRLHRERSAVPPLGQRSGQAGHRHRQRAGHETDRPVAGPRGHVYPRVEEPAGLAPLPDRDPQRDAAARPARGNRHRAEAQRADGPRLYSHDRPRLGHRPPDGRSEAAWAG